MGWFLFIGVTALAVWLVYVAPNRRDDARHDAAVLEALARIGEGGAVDIHEATKLRYSAIYPATSRLMDRGLVVDRWVEVEGRQHRRRMYRLAPGGPS